MKNNPKVSIIIPVYNGSNYLKEAIESALGQNYKNIEILVINDGSSDKGATEKIAKSYGQKIRYFKKKNGGTGSALNLGLQKMTGDYFAWLSHDDLFLPQKIKVQIENLKKSSAKTILYSDFEFIDTTGKILGTIKIKAPKSDQFIYDLIKKRFLHGCTILIPRLGFEKVGQFNEKLINTQDYEMWFRLSHQGFIFKHIPQVLVKGRLHAEQGSNLRQDIQIREEEFIYSWVIKNFTPSEIFGKIHNISYYYLDLAFSLKKTGSKAASKIACQKALKYLNFDNFLFNLFYYCYVSLWSEKISLVYWRNKFMSLLR